MEREPRYKAGPRDWQIFLALTRLFFVYFTVTGVKKIVRYTKGLRYIEVLYIEIPLYSALRPKSDNGIENYINPSCFIKQIKFEFEPGRYSF